MRRGWPNDGRAMDDRLASLGGLGHRAPVRDIGKDGLVGFGRLAEIQPDDTVPVRPRQPGERRGSGYEQAQRHASGSSCVATG